MARRPRLVQPGIAHHITQRGNYCQQVFFNDHDRARYLQILARHARRHDLRILAWCLMTNHIHLIAIPEFRLSMARAIGQAHAQFSLEQNEIYGRTGHLWQNRFYSCPLDTGHLRSALAYVDLNPVRAGMVPQASAWPWSSARAHTTQRNRDPLLNWHWRDWMESTRLGSWDFGAWESVLSTAQSEFDVTRLRHATKRGDPYGSPEFLATLEEQTGRRLRAFSRGRPRRPPLPEEELYSVAGG